MALPAVFGLPVLPPELLLRVLRLLDVSSLLALSSVNRHLHQTTTDPALWRHLYRRDFRDCQDLSRDRGTQWKELYKKKYKWRREAASYPRHMPRYHPVPHPSTPSTPFPTTPSPSTRLASSVGSTTRDPASPVVFCPAHATTLLVRSQVTIPQQEG
eukprot:XP_014041253.1 PREDICTED: F-box only protein 7-like [Salmo salar]